MLAILEFLACMVFVLAVVTQNLVQIVSGVTIVGVMFAIKMDTLIQTHKQRCASIVTQKKNTNGF